MCRRFIEGWKRDRKKKNNRTTNYLIYVCKGKKIEINKTDWEKNSREGEFDARYLNPAHIFKPPLPYHFKLGGEGDALPLGCGGRCRGQKWSSGKERGQGLTSRSNKWESAWEDGRSESGGPSMGSHYGQWKNKWGRFGGARQNERKCVP